MNRKWWKLIYMLPITFCTLYAGGYVAQFIRNSVSYTHLTLPTTPYV